MGSCGESGRVVRRRRETGRWWSGEGRGRPSMSIGKAVVVVVGDGEGWAWERRIVSGEMVWEYGEEMVMKSLGKVPREGWRRGGGDGWDGEGEGLG